LFPRFSRYSSKQATNATKAYLKLSNELGISLSTLSLAFVNERPFVSSNIIGATSLEQLKENICSIETKLSEDVILKINEIHSKTPNPSP
jgi:aryl-alcohol dehydrogenase-like predicted oxidoreductase